MIDFSQRRFFGIELSELNEGFFSAYYSCNSCNSMIGFSQLRFLVIELSELNEGFFQ